MLDIDSPAIWKYFAGERREEGMQRAGHSVRFTAMRDMRLDGLHPISSYRQLLVAAIGGGLQPSLFRDYARNPERKSLLLIRHDVDCDLDAALEMAALEAEMGVQATYFLLPPGDNGVYANYYGRIAFGRVWHTRRLLVAARKLIELGHEVGIHNDFLQLSYLTGRPVGILLAAELAWFREKGIRIDGTAAHGSDFSKRIDCVNYEIFAGCTKGDKVVGRLVSRGQWSCKLHALFIESFNLSYEAYFLPRISAFSDSGRKPTFYGPDKGKRGVVSLVSGADFTEFESAVADTRDGCMTLLVHPNWWTTSESRCASPGKEHLSLISSSASWSCFGIRDPSILSTAAGLPIIDSSGDYTLYFNARSAPEESGGVTCVGVARGSPRTGWRIDPTPVLVDGKYAAQGCVLKVADNDYCLYYSRNTQSGFCLAHSSDGRTWQSCGDDDLLRPAQFGVRRMGLPYVIRDGQRWLMVFEGIDAGRFHIYMASSIDGLLWQPENDGNPVYTPDGDSWDSHGQANPSLWPLRYPDGRHGYVMLYNGCATAHGWDIGLLTAASPLGPWTCSAAPFLRRGERGEWNAGRVEGARLLLTEDGSASSLMYFALPSHDSYQGGQIATSELPSALMGTRLHAEASPSTADAIKNITAQKAFNDKLSTRYFDIWDKFPIQRFTATEEARLLTRNIPPGSRVLVLGSGGGRELPALLALKCTVTAVDVSGEMLTAGRQRYQGVEITWIEADVHSLPLKDRAFDAAVGLGAILNYLTDPARFLAEVRRVLLPGGLLFLSSLNAEHPTEINAKSVSADGRVRFLYRRHELAELLSNANLILEQEHGIRFLVDMVPDNWNVDPTAIEGRKLLSRLLSVESRLCELLPADRAKFMFIIARRAAE